MGRKTKLPPDPISLLRDALAGVPPTPSQAEASWAAFTKRHPGLSAGRRLAMLKAMSAGKAATLDEAYSVTAGGRQPARRG